MNQLGFPSVVTPAEVARKASLGAAISLCAEVAGLEPKEVQDALKSDKAQFSRWTDNKEGITWAKLEALMDLCGNDAPLLWMVCQRGYDLASLRRKETEIERELREAREQIEMLQHDKRVLTEALSGRSS